jgi:hypothetical protein
MQRSRPAHPSSSLLRQPKNRGQKTLGTAEPITMVSLVKIHSPNSLSSNRRASNPENLLSRGVSLSQRILF